MGKKYKHPPVIEALCEIQFEQNTSWTLTVPGLLYEQVRGLFPKQREALRLNLGFSSTQGTLSQEVGTTPLIQFLRSDEKALIQVGPYLLAVNHLAPYPTWAEFLPIIEQGIQAYRKVAEPTTIRRIGLRYINRIEIPGERIQLEEYLEFYPFVGKALPQEFASFIIGMQAPYENARDSLRLQLTTGAIQTPHTITLLLDIDYSLAQSGAVALDDLSQWIAGAHDHVEQTFEGCIKGPLRQLFEEI
jgi:uncharacterized protein (TIGR04255 family)